MPIIANIKLNVNPLSKFWMEIAFDDLRNEACDKFEKSIENHIQVGRQASADFMKISDKLYLQLHNLFIAPSKLIHDFILFLLFVQSEQVTDRSLAVLQQPVDLGLLGSTLLGFVF